MEKRYFDHLDEADRSADVKVVVVTGAGRGFCAGVDMAALRVRSESGRPRVRDSRPIHHVLSVRKPVIAAINGGCAGVGLLQALLCDIRFATDDAKITTSFARLGIVAEYGTSWLLQQLIGLGRATEFLLSGRVMLGEEAAAVGLVSGSFESQERLVEATLEYARTIASRCSPSSLALIKGQLSKDSARSWADADADAAAIMARPELIPDFEEGVKAFTERRAPAFLPLAPRETP